MEDISGRITREVTSWEGVTSRPHRFGGIEFRPIAGPDDADGVIELFRLSYERTRFALERPATAPARRA